MLPALPTVLTSQQVCVARLPGFVNTHSTCDALCRYRGADVDDPRKELVLSCARALELTGADDFLFEASTQLVPRIVVILMSLCAT